MDRNALVSCQLRLGVRMVTSTMTCRTPPCGKFFQKSWQELSMNNRNVRTSGGDLWQGPLFHNLAGGRRPFRGRKLGKSLLVSVRRMFFWQGPGPRTIQNARGSHKARSRDRSAGPSLRLAAAGCQLGCGQASTKNGIIRDLK